VENSPSDLNILFMFPIIWKLLVFNIFIHMTECSKQLYHVVMINRNTVAGFASRVGDIET